MRKAQGEADIILHVLSKRSYVVFTIAILEW